MSKNIKTNIKFYKGLDNVADRLYGFVTKVNGSWRGCRSDNPKKRIVFVDPTIAKDVEPQLLYRCSLRWMNNQKGLIAISAKRVLFSGTITTTCTNDTFQVKVRFGMKEFVYDPSSSKSCERDIKAIADIIRNRRDLENAQGVAEDFINNACIVKRLYEQSQAHV